MGVKGAFIDHFPRGIGDPGGDVPALMRWARASDISPKYTWQTGMLLLGRAADERLIGISDNRHHAVVAGSRAGKNLTVIWPNLALYPGSCICLDPKGENAALTAARRGKGSAYCEGMGQRVYILDPFGTVPNHASACFNPLDSIDTQTPAGLRLATDNAALLADAIVMPGSDKEPHWDESARQLISALILHVATTEAPHRRNLVRVHELLTQGDTEAAQEFGRTEEDEDERRALSNPLMALLARMEDNGAFGGAISGMAVRLAGMGSNERGSILSTASRNIRFLESPPMQDVLQTTSEGLRLADLKAAPEGMTVYLCLPASRMSTHQRWLRIMIALSLAAMERERARPGHPVLFLLDEMPTLGAMEAIAGAAGLMAGYGVKLLFVLQDLTQIQRLYDKTWETFLGNAGCLQFFGNTDVTTLDHIARRLGQTKVVEVNQSESSGRQDSSSVSYQAKVADLVQPAEARFLFSREKGNQVVAIADELPWALRRVPFFDPFFDGKRDWTEGYGEAPPTLESLRRRPAEEPKKRGWFR